MKIPENCAACGNEYQPRTNGLCEEHDSEFITMLKPLVGSTWCIKCSSDKKANEKEYAEYIYKGSGYCEECYQEIRKLLRELL